MKAIMIILASMVLLTAGAGNANAGNPKTSGIDRLLKKEITYPDFARSQKLEGMVLVSFSLNSDGTINIQLTNESSATLKDYVISKLKSLRFTTSSGSDNKTYNVKFVFSYEM
jgi:outer membrane biosynthesis protein TonB